MTTYYPVETRERAVGYHLTLDVDLEAATMGLQISILASDDRYHQALSQSPVTTFCYTWRDVVEAVEMQLRRFGWQPNPASRPSPYVDLT